MEKRYERNFNTFSMEEMDKIKKFKVCVVGCGGLGGYIIEMLARLGIGSITGVDADSFEESNLNRQLYSSEKVLGYKKPEVALERIKAINSNVIFVPVCNYLDSSNAQQIIQGHDIVIDALDNMISRKILAKACNTLKIPMIHGAIAGWYGQVSAIMPGDDTLNRIYSGEANKGAEEELGNPSFTPALVASIEVAEAIKLLLEKGEILQNKILIIDLLNQEYEVFEI